MKVFVINLKKDIKKREQITQECEKHHLEFELLEAVSGKDLSQDELLQKVSKPALEYLTLGEIGCALSHLAIYNKIISDDIPYALILEDDAILSPDLDSVLSAIISQIKPDQKRVYLLYKTEKVYSNRVTPLNNDYLLYESRTPTYTHGYIITNKAARTLLKINSPVLVEADAWHTFYFMSFLKIYALNKDLITTRDVSKEDSSIESERLSLTRHQLFLRKKIDKRFSFIKIYHKLVRRIFLRQIEID